jgi:thioester reductase-like protein
VLFELLNDDSVKTIYCLTRREEPLKAVMASLSSKGLLVSSEQLAKVVALSSCLDQPDFGLSLQDSMIEHMLDSVSLIIHTAWPVNFNLPLSEFEPHIQGLYNLIQFSLSVHSLEPAVLMFCSSISTVLASPSATVPEEPMNPNCALVGYGQSKMVGEHIVSHARQSGARAYSLRIGQVSGHSKRGLWNDSEALPLMIRSALTLGALPELSQPCSWFPVDKLACSIIELAKSCAVPTHYSNGAFASSSEARYIDDSIFNLCNPNEFAWSSVLDTLRLAGFHFATLPFQDWLDRLYESEAKGEEVDNPAVKLIPHYEAMYGKDSSLVHNGPRRFLTNKAEMRSVTVRNGRLRIMEDGIMRCYAEDWLTRWTVA